MTNTTEDKKTATIPSLDEHHYYLFNSIFEPSSCGSLMTWIIQRNLMPQKERPDEIKLLINSPGGEVPSAFALIDCIKGSYIPVTTFGLGLVASCGLLTFMSGEKGRRFVTPNTSIMSHQFAGISMGKEHELFADRNNMDMTSQRILNHYCKCTGLSEKKVKDLLLPAQDVWLTAKEAVKYGIADKIVEFY